MQENNKDIVPERLLAENATLKLLIQEYQQEMLQKNIAQKEWQENASANAAIKSYFDLQTQELIHVREYVQELMQQAEGAALRESELEKQVSIGVSTGYKLADIQSQCNLLQAQLSELSERMQELLKLQILQHQQLSRIAELESMLAIAEEEIDLLKRPVAPGT